MKRQFWGLMLILFGSLALLQVTGPYRFGLSFWPVVLTIVGLWILSSSFRHTSWFGLALGLWLTGMGVVDMANAAGYTTLTRGDVVSNGWPVLLVAIGLSMIFGGRKWVGRRHFHFEGKSHLVGDQKMGGGSPWKLDKDLTMDHGIGDVKLDLTNAEITEGVHNIHVNAWIGDMVIRVPDNVNLAVDAEVSIGELEVLDERRDGMGNKIHKSWIVPDATAELRITARLNIGDVRIVRGPAMRIL